MDKLTKHEARLLRHKLKDELKTKGAEEKASINKGLAFKKIGITSAIVIVLLAAIAYGYYAYNSTPGPYDSFAKCLTEKGAIMYGAIEWCKYTKEQAGMFGKSFKYIDYKNYKERSDITITPTWIINGERLERVQSFDRLAGLTGCSYR